MGGDAYGINRQTIGEIVQEIKAVADMGSDRRGHRWRQHLPGCCPAATGMDRAQADYMGMLATVMNSLAMQDAMRVAGIPCRVQSALSIEQVVEPYIRGKAIRYLEQGRIVILRQVPATRFHHRHCRRTARRRDRRRDRAQGDQGRWHLYADPKKDASATRYDRISFDEAISRGLGVMDATAFALCRDQKLPINVFSIFKTGALKRVVMGENEGTLVYC